MPEDTSKTTRLFVYGTLMKGFHNNHLLTSSKYLGGGMLEIPYYMVSLGDAFPALTPCEGLNWIKGELYEVTENTLDRVDRLEGHPWFYRRERIFGDIFGYIMDTPEIVTEVTSGDWRSYVNDRA